MTETDWTVASFCLLLQVIWSPSWYRFFFLGGGCMMLGQINSYAGKEKSLFHSNPSSCCWEIPFKTINVKLICFRRQTAAWVNSICNNFCLTSFNSWHEARLFSSFFSWGLTLWIWILAPSVQLYFISMPIYACVGGRATSGEWRWREREAESEEEVGEIGS